MTQHARIWMLAGLVFFSSTASVWALDAKLDERIHLSATAFHELMESADSSVPTNLLKKCEAIVIFPRTLNIAWGLGGEYGKGVAMSRNRKTGEWSSPAFYTLGGLTLGPQIGGQAVDIVLVVMNEKGLTSLLESQCTLGGDAGIAVGPAGRNATMSTDLGIKAEIYSYSRAKGLFIGLSLKGALVKPDASANQEYYGRPVTAREILIEKSVPRPSYEKPLRKELNHFVPATGLPWGWVAAVVVLCAAAVFFRRK